MKKNILPVIAALIIALLVVPLLPVQAATPTGSVLSVVTIPQDDQKRQTGIMVLGLAPTENDLGLTGDWYSSSTCTGAPVAATTAVGPGVE